MAPRGKRSLLKKADTAQLDDATGQLSSQDPGTLLTIEQIEAYLAVLLSKGMLEETVRGYRGVLLQFYKQLSPDKQISVSSLPLWRSHLLETGYAPRTVNRHVHVVNGLLTYLHKQEYWLEDSLKVIDDAQPELTRNEYLRLLSTARMLHYEKEYLLIKLFATTGVVVQEIYKVTVEAVKEGRMTIKSNGVSRMVYLPGFLQAELLEYANKQNITSGPLFFGACGKPIDRTVISRSLRKLSHDAHVGEEKCNPRCLQKLYQHTMTEIEDRVRLLVEQNHLRLLEQEQLSIGWKE